jgi:hypothetical protein
MTEAEWLACTDPRAMLKYLTGRADHDPLDGRFLLFAAASVRQQWQWLLDGRSRAAVAAAEGYVEGWVDEVDFDHAQKRAEEAYDEAEENASEGEQEAGFLIRYGSYAAFCLTFCGPDDAWFAADDHAGNHLPHSQHAAFKPAQVALARCIFGNPFRSIAFDPSWLTPLVASLAEAAHDERREPEGTLDVERMAILADALEDAGCTEPVILEHLRGPGPHVWGCWVLGLLLPEE